MKGNNHKEVWNHQAGITDQGDSLMHFPTIGSAECVPQGSSMNVLSVLTIAYYLNFVVLSFLVKFHWKIISCRICNFLDLLCIQSSLSHLTKCLNKINFDDKIFRN